VSFLDDAISRRQRNIIVPSALQGTPDPFWNDVVLLLHYNGSFANAFGFTFSQGGSTGTAFSVNPPGPVLAGSGSFFGNGNAFAGGNTAVAISSFSDTLDLNATDFTLEQFSFVPSANSRPRSFCTIRDSGSGDGLLEYFLGLPNGGAVNNLIGGVYPSSAGFTTVINGTNTPYGSWVHSALVREGNTYSIYVEGVRYNVATNAYRRPAGPKRIFIGQSTSTLSDGFYGYIDETRITKAARYSGATYVIPSYPFPDY
jgi:hypothetical protein